MKSATVQKNSCLKDQKIVLRNKIGSGAFSKVYLGENLENQKLIAVKTERVGGKGHIVLREGKVLTLICSKGRKEGIPEIYWYGSIEGAGFMAFELLGPNLESLRGSCNKKFSLKCVLMIAHQMLQRLEYLHSCGFLHCDLKPANFAIGYGDKSHIIYLIDYGLCVPFKDLKTGEHKPFKEGKTLQGNMRFASANAQLGAEQSRRDDLESLFYVLMYLYKGKFPWDEETCLNKAQNYLHVMENKMSFPPELLCKGLPDEFLTFFTYCKELSFKEKPDYEYLKGLILMAMKNNGLVYDFGFDWISSKEILGI